MVLSISTAAYALELGPDDWIAEIHHIERMQSGGQMEMRM